MTVADEIVSAGNRSRLIRMTAACAFSIVALLIGAWLMFKGVQGPFTILTEIKGWKLYMSSLAPGLLFLICGTIVMCLAVMKKLSMKTDHGNGHGFTKFDD